jgi:hypothetical protein
VSRRSSCLQPQGAAFQNVASLFANYILGYPPILGGRRYGGWPTAYCATNAPGSGNKSQNAIINRYPESRLLQWHYKQSW